MAKKLDGIGNVRVLYLLGLFIEKARVLNFY